MTEATTSPQDSPAKAKISSKSGFSKCIDKSIDFIFSKDSRKWLLLIFILGLIIRIIVAMRVDFIADEVGHGPHSIGFISSGKLQIMDQDALWFWFSDLAMKIIGVNAIGIRFLSILFGSLAIILIYLLGRELFSEKAGLVASFIFALSPFQLVGAMRAEMDATMTFFIFLSIFLLVMFFKTENKKFFVFSWASLGVAIMVKQIALILIPVLVIFSLYYNKKHHKEYRIKQIIYAALIILLMVIPVLSFNYLLYKDKGIVDLQFSRFTGVGKDTVYAAIAPSMQPFTIGALFSPIGPGRPIGIIEGFFLIYDRETILTMLFALVGLLLMFRNKNKFSWLLTFSFLVLFVFLSGTSLMATHFVWGSAFVALTAGLAITTAHEKINERDKKYAKIFIVLVLIAIAAISIIMTNNDTHGIGKEPLGKMIDVKDQHISKNALVIADSRIYRGRIVFMFQDRHYLEANYFPQIMQDMDKIPGTMVPVETYYIQCVPTDCGWGTVGSQPDFNATMENITSFFKGNANFVTTVNGIDGKPYFNIYRQTFNMKSGVLNVADSTHDWLFYPVNYEPASAIFDNYKTNNSFDALVDSFAHMVLYLDLLVMAFLSFYLFYLLYKEN